MKKVLLDPTRSMPAVNPGMAMPGCSHNETIMCRQACPVLICGAIVQ